MIKQIACQVAGLELRPHFLRFTCALMLLLSTIQVSRRLNKTMMQVLISCGAGTLGQ